MKTSSLDFSRAEKCSGLRPSSDGRNCLEASGTPAVLSASGSRRPICSLRIDGTEATLFASGQELRLARGPLYSNHSLESPLTGLLPGTPVCALGGDNEALLMLESQDGHPSTLRLRFSGSSCHIVSEPRFYPAILLESTGAGSFSATAAPRAIPASDIASLTPSRETLAAFGADAADCYRRCAESALASGALVQPAFVRYRLLDASGRRLFESHPVLLSRDNSCVSQATSFMERAISADGIAGAATMTLSAWCPKITVPEGFAAAAPEVAVIEVLAGEQFHPYHPDSIPAGYIVSHNGARSIRTGLPGINRGLCTDTYESSCLRLRGALASLSRHERVVLRIGPEPGSHIARGEINGDVPSEISRLDKAISTGAPASVCPILEWPNSLWARTVASDAGVTVWGNLCGLRFPGSRLSAMSIARDADSGEWRARVSVLFAEGNETTVVEDSGNGNVPTLLSPIICYPSADAVKMRIQLTVGGRIFDKTFTLSPDPAGTIAFYAAPDFEPISLLPSAPGSLSPVVPVRFRHALPDALGISFGEDPAALTHIVRPGGGAAVRGICRSMTGNQAWEFGRRRFVVGTADGIYSLSVSSSGHSMRRVWPSGIGRRDALAEGGTAGVFALDLQGTLLRIKPSGSVESLEAEAAGPWISFIHSSGLLLTGGGGILNPSTGRRRADPALANATEAFSCAARPLLSTTAGALIFADASLPAPTQIDIRIPFPERIPEAIILNMEASSLDLILEVRVASALAPALTIGRLRGSAKGPLKVRILGRRTAFRNATLRLSGSVAGDFRLNSIDLCG